MAEYIQELHRVQDIAGGFRDPFTPEERLRVTRWELDQAAQEEFNRLFAEFHDTDNDDEKCRIGRLIAKQFDFIQSQDFCDFERES